MASRQEQLRQRLGELGFDDVRFTTLVPLRGDVLGAWLEAGMHGEMQWMERTAEKRLRPELVLPGAKSVIMLGVNYWSGESPGSSAPARPEWARYARYEDYHDTFKSALERAGEALEEICGGTSGDYRYYVDTGPLLERGWAAKAGLGFIGKNAMLISRRHGNWLFLAGILTRCEFAPDEPVRQQVNGFADVGLLCGKCTRCLDACPTQAFAAPGVVDARRCISYQTIENKGVIPRELRPGIGTRIYGCDVCLDVCPWNRFAQKGRQLLLAARDDITALDLREILELTPERFAEVFRRTPINRVKLAGLLRNACVVAGNSGDATLLSPLVRLAAHALPMVRVHAVWAVYRLNAAALLAELRARENDPVVLEEYASGEAMGTTEKNAPSPPPWPPAAGRAGPAGR
ncbi:MAG: tRNA epoxyqueuosine(34) reductase QueG [Opitutaceae bacterium]